ACIHTLRVDRESAQRLASTVPYVEDAHIVGPVPHEGRSYIDVWGSRTGAVLSSAAVPLQAHLIGNRYERSDGVCSARRHDDTSPRIGIHERVERALECGRVIVRDPDRPAQAKFRTQREAGTASSGDDTRMEEIPRGVARSRGCAVG